MYVWKTVIKQVSYLLQISACVDIVSYFYNYSSSKTMKFSLRTHTHACTGTTDNARYLYQCTTHTHTRCEATILARQLYVIQSWYCVFVHTQTCSICQYFPRSWPVLCTPCTTVYWSDLGRSFSRLSQSL